MKRLSIRDKKFIEYPESEEVTFLEGADYNAVIVNAAPIARAYYKEDYDPAKLAVPTCWSSNTQTPSAEVPAIQRQSTRCMDCKFNIRGSGRGSSRACRFFQYLAIAPEDRWEDIYQLRLPATSIFGEVRDGHMPMVAYARFLQEMDTPAIAVLTKMYFDRDSETPKLFFKPSRPLGVEELSVVSGIIDDPETLEAITLTNYTFLEGLTKSPFEVTDGFTI